MPIQCGTSVLTGQDGSIWFKPAGTTACLKDFTDFPAGAEGIILPATSDFKIGDKIKFKIEGGATLDTAVNQSNTYVIGGTIGTRTRITNLAGTAITFAGDGGTPPDAKGPILTFGAIVGGTGYANGVYSNVELITLTGVGAGVRANITVSGGAVTAVALVAGQGGDGYAAANSLSANFLDIGGTGSGFTVAVATITNTRDDSPAGHINVSYSEFAAVCNVSSFDLNMTRARIDITSLPCNFGTAAAGKFAPFRTYQPGFADGSGTMTVKFSRDQNALASRLLSNSLLRIQDGATARLFIDTVVGNSGEVLLDESSYIEVALSIEGMQFAISTDDSPTEATINFSFQNNPTHVFYTSLV
jgi:hypothetical protein